MEQATDLRADGHDATLHTVDEVAAAAGVTVRTLRFWAGKGLVPPPTLRGRVGLYGAHHLARLQLIRDLQAAGFTLTAVEGFLARIPADASAEDVEVFRALLTPWVTDPPELLDHDMLEAAAGRRLDDAALAALLATGLVHDAGDGRVRARPEDLQLGLALLDLPVPMALVTEAHELIDAATDQLAEQLAESLRRHLFRPYVAGVLPAEQRSQLSGVIERLRPLTIQAVMRAMERSVDRAVRGRLDGDGAGAAQGPGAAEGPGTAAGPVQGDG